MEIVVSEAGKRLIESAQDALATARDRLFLKSASRSRPSGEWNEDDFNVLAADLRAEVLRERHAEE
jgi:hypothetical protein